MRPSCRELAPNESLHSGRDDGPAVIAAVDPGHVGSATGVNSAIARVAGFHGATLVGYGLALLAGLSAWLLIETTPAARA